MLSFFFFSYRGQPIINPCYYKDKLSRHINLVQNQRYITVSIQSTYILKSFAIHPLLRTKICKSVFVIVDGPALFVVGAETQWLRNSSFCESPGPPP